MRSKLLSSTPNPTQLVINISTATEGTNPRAKVADSAKDLISNSRDELANRRTVKKSRSASCSYKYHADPRKIEIIPTDPVTNVAVIG